MASADPYRVRVIWTHGAAGEPVAVERVDPLPRSIYAIEEDARRFAAPYSPRRTPSRGVFAFGAPGGTQGWLVFEGFGEGELERITEQVFLEEIARAVGRQPLRNPELGVGNAIALRFSNPFFFFGAALVLFILVGYLVSRLTPDLLGLVVVLAVLFSVLAVLLIVMGAIRAPWWFRARAYAREHGGIPPALRGYTP